MQWQRVQRASQKLSTPYKYLTCCFGFCCIRNWKSKYFHFRQGFHNRLWLWHSIFWMFRVIFLRAAQSTGLFSWLSTHSPLLNTEYQTPFLTEGLSTDCWNMAKPGGVRGVLGWIKSFWTDSFKWDCVKSVGLFVLGVVIARLVTLHCHYTSCQISICFHDYRDMKGVSVMAYWVSEESEARNVEGLKKNTQLINI